MSSYLKTILGHFQNILGQLHCFRPFLIFVKSLWDHSKSFSNHSKQFLDHFKDIYSHFKAVFYVYYLHQCFFLPIFVYFTMSCLYFQVIFIHITVNFNLLSKLKSFIFSSSIFPAYHKYFRTKPVLRSVFVRFHWNLHSAFPLQTVCWFDLGLLLLLVNKLSRWPHLAIVSLGWSKASEQKRYDRSKNATKRFPSWFN